MRYLCGIWAKPTRGDRCGGQVCDGFDPAVTCQDLFGEAQKRPRRHYRLGAGVIFVHHNDPVRFVAAAIHPRTRALVTWRKASSLPAIPGPMPFIAVR